MFALKFDVIPYPHAKAVHAEKYNYLFLETKVCIANN
jgi:hypothetical protein